MISRDRLMVMIAGSVNGAGNGDGDGGCVGVGGCSGVGGGGGGSGKTLVGYGFSLSQFFVVVNVVLPSPSCVVAGGQTEWRVCPAACSPTRGVLGWLANERRLLSSPFLSQMILDRATCSSTGRQAGRQAGRPVGTVAD